MQFLNMTGSDTSFTFTCNNANYSQAEKHYQRETDRGNSHGWLPSQNKPSRASATRSGLFTRAKVNQMLFQTFPSLSPQKGSKYILKFSYNSATAMMASIPRLRSWWYQGRSSFCGSLLLNFLDYTSRRRDTAKMTTVLTKFGE